MVNTEEPQYQEAMEEDPTLCDETISIVFFKDDGLQRSQQMFTDLNKHAVKTSNSLSTLYDSRDALAVVTKEIIDKVLFLNMYTDREKDILGKNSSNLFTLNTIYKANNRILHTKQCDENAKNFLLKYWKFISENVTAWEELMNHQITKKDLRENYIITLGITIQALGKLGAYFFDNQNMDLNIYISKFQEIDWLRSNKQNWLGRAIRIDGKVMNNEEAITLTCNKIKQLLDVKLSNEEKSKEDSFDRRLENGR